LALKRKSAPGKGEDTILELWKKLKKTPPKRRDLPLRPPRKGGRKKR